MFTGIIEEIGKIKAVSKDRLEVAVPPEWKLAAGESVAVNGPALPWFRSPAGPPLLISARDL